MKWRCNVCGEVFDFLPEVCPVCGAKKSAFSQYEDAAPAFRRDTNERFVIIGGGIAALQAAKAVRARNKTAAVTMLFSDAKIPYNRPGLSDYLGGGMRFSDIVLESYNYYSHNGISLMRSTAVEAIDRRNREVVYRGGCLPYDKLLIATGADAFNPFTPQAGAVPVFTLRSFSDAESITAHIEKGMRRAIVAGGGILGIEAAAALRTRGLDVVVVERGDGIAKAQLDSRASGLLADSLRKNGIKIFTGATVADIRPGGVELSGGEELPADFVIVSMGVRGNCVLAAECALTLNRAIAVNEYMQTSDENIFAAGDCAEYAGRAGGLWIIASAQGLAAGANMCGDPTPYKIVPFATAYEGFGTSFFSVGSCSDGESAVAVDEQKGIYKKLSVKDGRLEGIILFGDTADSNKAMDLIYSTDIERAKAELL